MKTGENNIHFMYCFYWGREAGEILKNCKKNCMFKETVWKIFKEAMASILVFKMANDI